MRKSYKIIQTRREENTMKRGFVLLVTVALFIIVFVAHYGEAAEVLKIGVIGPMTGGLAYFGTNWKMGVDIAVSQINDRGGIEVAGKRYSLETVGYDDEAKAEKAVAGVRKLAAEGFFGLEAATVVCTLTGHGLKDPEWAIAGAPKPTSVSVDAHEAAVSLGLA
jgi:hypothetical protein